MKKFLLLPFVCALLPLGNVYATPADDEFQKLAEDYIEARLRTYPEDATELGDHRFDDKLTDYSKEARAKELAAQKEFLTKLNAFKNTNQLTGANSVDFRILKENVEGEIFGLEELKSADWNPLTYNQSLANVSTSDARTSRQRAAHSEISQAHGRHFRASSRRRKQTCKTRARSTPRLRSSRRRERSRSSVKALRPCSIARRR
jgi:uncharacterized protein (DUF885 family)